MRSAEAQHLLNVLDNLRSLYELAKARGDRPLQDTLMRLRQAVLAVVADNAEAHAKEQRVRELLDGAALPGELALARKKGDRHSES